MAFCYRENALQQYYSLDQRIKKTVNGQSTLFFYDPQGHLLGEYAANGDLIQEIVWFGDLPVAAIKPNGQSSVEVFYIHADHLGTSRKITRPSDNQVLWTWESEAFGNTPPNENPTGQGAFVFNLRFPGQYYDSETGLHYNYFRDYDAGTGRYEQSDPIGLQAGVNTYGYVGGNPLSFIDPYGLYWPSMHNAMTFYAAARAGLPYDTARRFGDWAEQADHMEGSQKSYGSSWHAMCQAGTNIELCKQRFYDFVRSQTNLCTEEGFGRASHAIQDFFAPAHRNFPQFAGFSIFNLVFWVQAIPHFWGDAFPGNEEFEWVINVTQRFLQENFQNCSCLNN